MTSREDDLDLLLSLQERVLETPPPSPSNPHSHSPGYLSDDGSPRQRGKSDLSVFKNFVEDCLDYEPKPVERHAKSKPPSSNDIQVDKFSGLRIRKQLVSPVELSERLSDIRFVRLSTIKALIKHCYTYTSSVFALFSCSVRKDPKGLGFSLSATAANQILKIGTSADYGVCKGKRKDGMACTLVVNKRQGAYCQYHQSKASEKYSTKRTELMGGNLRTPFRNPPRSEGIYMVDPLSDKTNSKTSSKPVKLLSVEALKRALRCHQ
ncbi:Minichromosome maintenance 10 isoform 2 [Hibiscus syriacus]|uniref:Minichromosome maintenance 10 isoform 2 n=1 Tax=Hibiscus syriacus TaxID=106335 RepID=A0A6A2ZH44_HIBSY|nr:Minichromosome maintenance 10 isoform 2 [Hibiscus syriacus]